ncbi:CopG family ribbon-helix-helix protein [Commensalibacter nepenthis]|uniref:CopG family ribbon-helix-helix protein n=1 Tax=Commensalibacter nepenthis TaxID=3043872 RepID=A0ABT6Q5V5_9PROT|nr:CopG family ribbon-helix-helix protein [Commensalibacter sp. TBRC 10068]MDI2111720.1 CopG family ribbon-helix-helix protein [Commensalibacter sp. TBRC 10068]
MATTIKIDDNLKDRVHNLATSQNKTAHSLMKEAIMQYVEKEETREKFKQEALASWKEYCETGLHLTNEETINWLDTWGTDIEQEAPICHE